MFSGTQCQGDWHQVQASPYRTATDTEVPTSPVVRSNSMDRRADRSSVGSSAGDPNQAPLEATCSAESPSVAPEGPVVRAPASDCQLAAVQPSRPSSHEASTTGSPAAGRTVTVSVAVDVVLPLPMEYGNATVPTNPSAGTNDTVPPLTMLSAPPSLLTVVCRPLRAMSRSTVRTFTVPLSEMSLADTSMVAVVSRSTSRVSSSASVVRSSEDVFFLETSWPCSVMREQTGLGQ